MIALIIGAVALALRLHGLGDKPLWLDEIITNERAGLPIRQLITQSLESKHLPTYFLLVRPFASPVIDEWTLRLPTALFGATSVLLVTLVAAEAGSLRSGVAAGLLMALSPFEVQFAQEARPYALVVCFILLALWGLVRIGRNTSAAAVALHRPNGLPGAWAAYTIGTIGALNTLFTACPWLVVSNLGLAVVAWRAGPARRGLVCNWLLTQAAVLIAWLSGLAAIYWKLGDDPLAGLGWIPASTLHYFWLVVSAVYLFRISDLTTFALLPTPIPGFGAVVVIMALAGAWHLRRQANLLVTIGLAVAAMPMALLAVSIFHPLVVPRYLMWGTGPYYALAGIGVGALPRRYFPLAAAALVLGAGLCLSPYYGDDTKPRWDLATAYLAAHARPGEAVIGNGAMTGYVLVSYAPRYHLDPQILKTAHGIADAEPRYKQGKRVWAVYGRTGQGQIEPEEQYVAKLAPLGAPTTQVRLPTGIVILGFDPAQAAAPPNPAKAPE